MALSATSTTAEVLDGVDLTGAQALVTGASTGLGKETARALAAAGVRVVLAARDPDRGSAALQAVREAVPGAEVELGIVDLASLASVRQFAADFLAEHDGLDLLINNAGVMATPFGTTTDGFETQFGTNHLGHFLLTLLLLPRLVASSPSRIVNLSSGGHQSSDIHWDDPNFTAHPYDKWQAYGQSKTANILFTLELERRYADRGVHAYAVHPGMVGTELGRYMSRDDVAELMERVRNRPGAGGQPMLRKSVEQGAATTVWAATSPDLAETGGVYLADCQIAEPAAYSLDADAAQRLWAMSEDMVGERAPF